MSPIPANRAVEMVEVYPPSRPMCLGTQRRRPRNEGAASPVGASRPRVARPASLDTKKHPATTVAKWAQLQETPQDTYKKRYALWRRLCETVYGIWQDHLAQLHVLPRDGAEWRWWAAFDEEKAKIRTDESAEYDAWLDSYRKRRVGREFPSYSEAFASCRRDWQEGLVGTNETFLQQLYMEEWKKKNPPTRICAKALRWEEQYFQLFRCQSQWIGYRASCCPNRTRLIAVPIGCNHRLCPLCNWQRSQNGQRKARQLFDRFEHPQFITVTVPNLKRITKRSFEFFRKRVRQFLAQNKSQFRGGVYAIETTYNRAEKSWHIHAHILVDAVKPLPLKGETIEFCGKKMSLFTFTKMRVEFEWSRLWVKTLPKPLRANASDVARAIERSAFHDWMCSCLENRMREFRNGRWQEIEWLSASELQHRQKWNRENRRVLDIRPVTDRVRAVKEVLKYITKSSDFIDLPECVIAFYEATRGARLIQTWGSCYGLDFTIEFDTAHPEDWSRLECACGSNHWERFGVLYRRDVYMEASGQWRPRPEFEHNPRGTVPRPTIRALEAPEERTGDQPWQAI